MSTSGRGAVPGGLSKERCWNVKILSLGVNCSLMLSQSRMLGLKPYVPPSQWIVRLFSAVMSSDEKDAFDGCRGVVMSSVAANFDGLAPADGNGVVETTRTEERTSRRGP